MLVSNSLCAYVLANEVASLLESHPTVLEVYGYPEPRVSLSNRTCADRRVMIISDIVSSGTSITNLRSQLDQLGARVLGAIAAIDIGGAADRIDAEALLSFPDKQFTRFTCPQCQSGIAYQVIDPFTSMAVSLPSSTEEVSPVLSSEEFWELVLENDALREGHFSFNGHHFSVFIETTRMLKNATTTRRIAAAALQYYAKRALMFDCIVFPVHPGAVAFARAIWDAMRAASERPAPLLVPASRSPEGGHIIPPSYSESMRNASVLVVDDGVNFGDTLAGLYFAVSEFTPIIECCVFVDRLSSFYRRKLAAVLQGSKLTAVYRLAIPAVHKARCPICKERRGLQRLLTSSVGEEIRKSAQSRLAQLEIRPIDPDSQLTRSDRTTGDPVFAE
jgi:orotate phosphoribosyltransferase